MPSPTRIAWNRIYSDYLMPSRLGAYECLLEAALGAGYRIVSVERFWSLVVADELNTSGRYLILRHDMDTDSRAAVGMWQIEQALGAEGSYFFRRSTVHLPFMRAIADSGSHASYHYEELASLARARHARTAADALDLVPEAQDAFRRNLEGLRAATGLPMRVVASHGDFVNRKLGIANTVLLADAHFRARVGVDLETYDDALVSCFSSRHSDTLHPRHWIPDSPLAAITKGLPVIHVLVHPRHWQVRRIASARDDAARLWAGIDYALPRGPLARRSRRCRPAAMPALPPVGLPGGSADTTPGPQPVVAPSADTLVVEVPSGYQPERRYVLDVVLADWLGLRHEIVACDRPGVAIRVAGDPAAREVTLPDVLFATPADAWLTERSMPRTPFTCLREGPLAPDSGTEGSPTQPLPILFGDPGPNGCGWHQTDAGRAITVDIFGSVFFLLTRYEELVRPARDRFGRFPASASLAVNAGFIDRPIADEYVELLWESLRAVWPDLSRRVTSFRLRLTHDVDEVWAAHGRPIRAVVRSLVADLVRRRELDLAARRALSVLEGPCRGVAGDPFNTYDFLMDASERHGLRSTFYFVAGQSCPEYDADYRLSDPPVVDLLRRIHERGHEVGLHASYGSYDSPEVIRAESEALRAACGAAGFEQPTWGVRQHFLRLSNPFTWRSHEMAGLAHDSTLGYADQVGFRAGTCREYPLFDLLDRRQLALRERPLIVMDRTLSDYMALGPDRASDLVRSLVETCRRHRGDAVILFHNNSSEVRRGAYYERLIDLLANPR